MTILPGADIRGFYARLGVRLPEHAAANVYVRCFVAPDKHRREDRKASCSVKLADGKFKCHGCGARGGAYDAAVAAGHSPRSAIDLMIDYGLIERRARLYAASELPAARRRPPTTKPGAAAGPPIERATLALGERDVARYATQLAHRPALIARLQRDRGWSQAAIAELELGYDRGRITIPVRNAAGGLRGLLRYQPDRTGRPKMIAVLGSRNGLIPHPSTEPCPQVLLVEGPPDMIAARSRGLPAIAVPGTDAWQPRWAPLLAGRQVMVVMDCDPAGRAAAERIARSLARCARVDVVDLDPSREDGYDLTDRLLEHADQLDELIGAAIR
jgi:hypothetical protein